MEKFLETSDLQTYINNAVLCLFTVQYDFISWKHFVYTIEMCLVFTENVIQRRFLHYKIINICDLRTLSSCWIIFYWYWMALCYHIWLSNRINTIPNSVQNPIRHLFISFNLCAMFIRLFMEMIHVYISFEISNVFFQKYPRLMQTLPKVI